MKNKIGVITGLMLVAMALMVSAQSFTPYGYVLFPPGLPNQAQYDISVDEGSNTIVADALQNGGGYEEFLYTQASGSNYGNGVEPVQATHVQYMVDEQDNWVLFNLFVGDGVSYPFTPLLSQPGQIAGTMMMNGVQYDITAVQSTNQVVVTQVANPSGAITIPIVNGAAKLISGNMMFRAMPDWNTGTITIDEWVRIGSYMTL